MKSRISVYQPREIEKLRGLEALSASFPNHEGRPEEKEYRILRNLMLVMQMAFAKEVPFLPPVLSVWSVGRGEKKEVIKNSPSPA